MPTNKAKNKKDAGKPNEQVQPQQPEKNNDQQNTREAFNEAKRDIDLDADLGIHSHSPNEDLDEGESARLGEDKTDLV
jgi:hypothetical protein